MQRLSPNQRRYLLCYAHYLYRKLEGDVWAEGFLQVMEEATWLSCYCWRHDCPTMSCILPACHTRVMAVGYVTEGAKIAARLRGELN